MYVVVDDILILFYLKIKFLVMFGDGVFCLGVECVRFFVGLDEKIRQVCVDGDLVCCKFKFEVYFVIMMLKCLIRFVILMVSVFFFI